MKYFSPETSKKLEELELEPSSITGECENCAFYEQEWEYYKDGTDIDNTDPEWACQHCGTSVNVRPEGVKYNYSTLDICELENARKLWGEEDKIIYSNEGDYNIPMFEYKLEHYITLSDDERIKYVEEYLKSMK